MRPWILAAILPLLALGCTRAEPSTAAAIKADYAGHTDRKLRLSGTVVRPDSRVTYVWVGLANYFTLQDGTGQITVWHGARCSPRIGSELTVTGKVTQPEDGSRHLFSASSISVESSPPLGENQVRSCALSVEESRIYQMEGEQALQERWRSRGEPVREIVVD